MLGKIMAEQDIKIISHTHTHSGFKFKNCIEYNDIRYMAQSNNNSLNSSSTTHNSIHIVN